jgi:GNAT superfamily N-acetyltransferase
MTSPAGDARLVVTDAPTSEAEAAIRDGLSAYNFEKAGYRDHRPLAILVSDPETGEVVGGLLGGTSFGLLRIDRFFLPENLRKQGLGTRIIETAEEEGRRRGCTRALLTTLSFQAPGFYKRQGWEVLAELESEPPAPTVPDDEAADKPIVRGWRQLRTDQRRIARMTCFMNPSIAAGSVHRKTATKSFSGSIQVRLPPAPRA